MPSSLPKELYNPKAFFIHAAWLRQGCPHCAIFPTAASRRSLGRVSVPVWLVILSDQLEIVGLVSLYLTNYLIPLGLILWHVARRSHTLIFRYSQDSLMNHFKILKELNFVMNYVFTLETWYSFFVLRR